MKATWETLMFIVLLFGGSGTALAALISINAALMPGAIALAIMLICKLMVWRNEVYERNTTRHKETMKLLYGIYKAASHEN